jgi:hypothetical protein
MLLNAGANVDACTKGGDTALDLAFGRASDAASMAIHRWTRSSDAAAAFARGTMHARYYRCHEKTTHGGGEEKTSCAYNWTDSRLFDEHLIAEITSYVTSPPPLPPPPPRAPQAVAKA